MLAIFAMLCNISLSLSYTQYSLYLLFPHPILCPQPLITIGLFSISVNLPFCYIHSLYFSDFTYHIIQYLSFSAWLISLSILPSRSIHVTANTKLSLFLWLSSISLDVCTTSFLFSHLFYPLLCWWTLRLLPYFGCCK